MEVVKKKSYYLEKNLVLEVIRLSSILEISQSEFAEKALTYYVEFLKASLPKEEKGSK